MILDRQRLAQYVGSDAAFEAQFLALLLATVSDCMGALDPLTNQTYRSLHAAKPGLVVATTEKFAAQLSQVCDVLVEATTWPLPAPQVERLEDLRLQLQQLSLEIHQALAQRT